MEENKKTLSELTKLSKLTERMVDLLASDVSTRRAKEAEERKADLKISRTPNPKSEFEQRQDKSMLSYTRDSSKAQVTNSKQDIQRHKEAESSNKNIFRSLKVLVGIGAAQSLQDIKTNTRDSQMFHGMLHMAEQNYVVGNQIAAEIVKLHSYIRRDSPVELQARLDIMKADRHFDLKREQRLNTLFTKVMQKVDVDIHTQGKLRERVDLGDEKALLAKAMITVADNLEEFDTYNQLLRGGFEKGTEDIAAGILKTLKGQFGKEFDLINDNKNEKAYVMKLLKSWGFSDESATKGKRTTGITQDRDDSKNRRDAQLARAAAADAEGGTFDLNRMFGDGPGGNFEFLKNLIGGAGAGLHSADQKIWDQSAMGGSGRTTTDDGYSMEDHLRVTSGEAPGDDDGGADLGEALGGILTMFGTMTEELVNIRNYTALTSHELGSIYSLQKDGHNAIGDASHDILKALKNQTTQLRDSSNSRAQRILKKDHKWTIDFWEKVWEKPSAKSFLAGDVKKKYNMDGELFSSGKNTSFKASVVEIDKDQWKSLQNDEDFARKYAEDNKLDADKFVKGLENGDVYLTKAGNVRSKEDLKLQKEAYTAMVTKGSIFTHDTHAETWQEKTYGLLEKIFGVNKSADKRDRKRYRREIEDSRDAKSRGGYKLKAGGFGAGMGMGPGGGGGGDSDNIFDMIGRNPVKSAGAGLALWKGGPWLKKVLSNATKTGGKGRMGLIALGVLETLNLFGFFEKDQFNEDGTQKDGYVEGENSAMGTAVTTASNLYLGKKVFDGVAHVSSKVLAKSALVGPTKPMTRTIADLIKRWKTLGKKYGETKLKSFIAKKVAISGAAALIPGIGWLIGLVGLAWTVYEIWDLFDDFEKEAKKEESLIKGATTSSVSGIETTTLNQMKGRLDDISSIPKSSKSYSKKNDFSHLGGAAAFDEQLDLQLEEDLIRRLETPNVGLASDAMKALVHADDGPNNSLGVNIHNWDGFKSIIGDVFFGKKAMAGDIPYDPAGRGHGYGNDPDGKGFWDKGTGKKKPKSKAERDKSNKAKDKFRDDWNKDHPNDKLDWPDAYQPEPGQGDLFDPAKMNQANQFAAQMVNLSTRYSPKGQMFPLTMMNHGTNSAAGIKANGFQSKFANAGWAGKNKFYGSPSLNVAGAYGGQNIQVVANAGSRRIFGGGIGANGMQFGDEIAMGARGMNQGMDLASRLSNHPNSAMAQRLLKTGTTSQASKLLKLGGRAFPGVGAGLAAWDAKARFDKGDTLGATLSAGSGIPIAGLIPLAIQLVTDYLGLTGGDNSSSIMDNYVPTRNLNPANSGGNVNGGGSTIINNTTNTSNNSSTDILYPTKAHAPSLPQGHVGYGM